MNDLLAGSKRGQLLVWVATTSRSFVRGQFALGFKADEPGRGGSAAVVSPSAAGTALLAAWRTAGEPSDRAISASRR